MAEETHKQKLARLRDEQIAKLKKWQAAFLRRQDRQQKQTLAARRAKEKEARAAQEALHQPCARVWRVGRTLLWEPPETFDQLKPAGFWISEERNGAWTMHGDYLPAHAREAELFGDGPARVEVVYPNYLSRGKPSAIIEESPGEQRFAVSRVRYWCTQEGRPDAYYERWRRVLAGFGVQEGKKGHADKPEVYPLEPAMTAAEAQSYLDRGWGSRWEEVTPILRRLEAERGA